MSNEKPMLYPVAVCLFLGVAVAFLLPSGNAPEPVARLSASNAVPTAPVVPTMPSNEFAAYIDSGGSNIHAHLLAATNPVERAVWEDIERRFKQVDWASVAKTLSRSTNSSQSTNP